ncbi:MAG: hypothetical protein ACM3U1_11145 [Chloroflexota bacterium]
MKYLLFLHHSSGEMENALFTSLCTLRERLDNLLDEEELIEEFIPTTESIRFELDANEEYFSELSKGVWFHIQKEYKYFR